MRINTASIMNKANNLSVCIVEVKNEKNRINRLISDINDAWKGKKATEFTTNLKEKYVDELSKLEEILEKYHEFLSKVPRAYETLDEDYASKNINV